MDMMDKAFGKLFDVREDKESKKALKKGKMFLSADYCVGIIPKNDEILRRLEEFDIDERNPPALDYHPNAYEPMISKVSIEYLKIVVQILSKIKDETCLIYLKKDYPVTFRTKDIDIIVAPVVKYEPPKELEGDTDAEKSMNLFLSTLKKNGIDDDVIYDIKKYISTRMI